MSEQPVRKKKVLLKKKIANDIENSKKIKEFNKNKARGTIKSVVAVAKSRNML